MIERHGGGGGRGDSGEIKSDPPGLGRKEKKKGELSPRASAFSARGGSLD